MATEDVKDSAQSSGAGSSDEENRNLAADASDNADGDKSKAPRDIPYSRFKEVNDKAQKSQEVVDWYRKNIGDPDDVIAFRQWKTSQVEKAKEAEKDGDISPEKLAAIRKLMREADPEYKQLLEERKLREQERIDAQFDDAEEQIRDLTKAAGLPQDEKIISRVAAHVMDEIRSDEKLMRMWQTGNMKCIPKAWEKYQEEYLSPMRKVSGKAQNDLADKRRISRLPSLPSGGSPATSKAIERKPEDKGINKQTHDDAWAVVQAHMNE
jgi:hypothetical protein